MTIEQIIEMLTDILVRDLEVPVPRERIHAGSAIELDLGLDSVAVLALIAAIEKRLGFELPDTVLRAGTFRTVRSVAEAIAASMVSRPST